MVSEAKQASEFVKRKINWLVENSNESTVKATLAKLRRGIGKAPGSLPELWDVTLNGLPEALLSKGEKPTRGEWAVHTALTLYALHQQGKNPKEQCMNMEGESLGTAVRKLIESNKNNEEAVRRRFHAVAVSESFERFCWQLRGMIQLLRAKSIPLDYPGLTEDLYWFQLPERQDSIRLKWGQDFYRTLKDDKTDNEKNYKGESN